MGIFIGVDMRSLTPRQRQLLAARGGYTMPPKRPGRVSRDTRPDSDAALASIMTERTFQQIAINLGIAPAALFAQSDMQPGEKENERRFRWLVSDKKAVKGASKPDAKAREIFRMLGLREE